MSSPHGYRAISITRAISKAPIRLPIPIIGKNIDAPDIFAIIGGGLFGFLIGLIFVSIIGVEFFIIIIFGFGGAFAGWHARRWSPNNQGWVNWARTILSWGIINRAVSDPELYGKRVFLECARAPSRSHIVFQEVMACIPVAKRDSMRPAD